MLQIANEAKAEGRDETLGIVYDRFARSALLRCVSTRGTFIHVRFCRSTWEDEASKFGSSYDVDKKAAAICDVILRRAKAQFLTASGNGQSASGQSHGRSTK